MSNVKVKIPERNGLDVDIGGVTVTESDDYNDLKNRPMINGTLIEGDVPLSDLGINNVASLIFTEVT